jgi:hypothetical protein
MQIKWCKDVFKKDFYGCSYCSIIDESNPEKYCYGIFYIFHKIAQIRFFFIGLFRAIKRLIEKIKDGNQLVNCLDCYCLVKKKLKKCPYCGGEIDDIPF